jgi:hypothetical protein
MTDIKWEIRAREFVNCNCSYGCPCQFNALPTHSECKALAAFEIIDGHHGYTRLDGLTAAGVLAWPGPIHEGKGEAQIVIDERATEAQRDALLRILSGRDTEPGATVWQVFSTTFEKVHEPIFRRIEFQVDVDGRTARVLVPGLIEARGEPNRSRAPRAHRYSKGLRVFARRNGARVVQGIRCNQAQPCRLLRPVRQPAS